MENALSDRLCYRCFSKIKARADRCPQCGFDFAPNEAKHPCALRQGTILKGNYEVGCVLGQGGFGITYVAYSWKLKMTVAVKEFFPQDMVRRSGKKDTEISLIHPEDTALYQKGIQRFITEARNVARFRDVPSIVNIYECFYENKTAYYVMDYLIGCNLAQYIKNNDGHLDWQEALELIAPVMDALEAVHSERMIHRDVTPDNIYITTDKRPILLDFGSARQDTMDSGRSVSVMVKHGFAPCEQYGRRQKQGPFTDIYSLGASFYYAVTGHVIQEALDRKEADQVAPLSACVGMPKDVSDIWMKALAVLPENRYPNIAGLRTALFGATGMKQFQQEKQRFHRQKRRAEQIPAPERPEPAKQGIPASASGQQWRFTPQTTGRTPPNPEELTRKENAKPEKRSYKDFLIVIYAVAALAVLFGLALIFQYL